MVQQIWKKVRAHGTCILSELISSCVIATLHITCASSPATHQVAPKTSVFDSYGKCRLPGICYQKCSDLTDNRMPHRSWVAWNWPLNFWRGLSATATGRLAAWNTMGPFPPWKHHFAFNFRIETTRVNWERSARNLGVQLPTLRNLLY